MAIDSIVANKMRSFLTMLGIIIGISSVITIVSLGNGGQKSITGEFEKIGAATVKVTVNASKATKGDYITFEDVKQIQEKVPTVKYITPALQKRGSISTDKKEKMAFLSGVSEDDFYMDGYEMLYGRFFNQKEYQQGKQVLVIDENSAKAMFGYTDVVGKTVKAGKADAMKQFTIVGVTKAQGFMMGDSEDIPAICVVPATAVSQLYPEDNLMDSLVVTATSKEEAEATGNAVSNLLVNRHGNRGRDIYKAESMMKQLDQINKVLGIFTAFISAVAAISLLVGGIGVMNIMLVSVTERTREIGIRKAIGATTRTIMLQFLTESVIISLIGGIIGMIFGILGAEVIGMFAKISPVLSIKAIAGAILFSSAVGIFFGIYPARKAAKLDPIDALRYE